VQPRCSARQTPKTESHQFTHLSIPLRLYGVSRASPSVYTGPWMYLAMGVPRKRYNASQRLLDPFSQQFERVQTRL
jgi:hypothetical protein